MDKSYPQIHPDVDLSHLMNDLEDSFPPLGYIEPSKEEEEEAEMSLQGQILIDILKTVTRLEDKMKHETGAERFSNDSSISMGPSPQLEAILMDNPLQS